MLDVRELSHVALREAREIARGYRKTDLAVELEGARTLLEAAGIGWDADVQGIPQRWKEPAAWVVREAVTNVLRHSNASTVRVSWDGDTLTVKDDGTQANDFGSSGSGLAGLRERLAASGANLVVKADANGFTLTMLTTSAVAKVTT